MKVDRSLAIYSGFEQTVNEVAHAGVKPGGSRINRSIISPGGAGQSKPQQEAPARNGPDKVEYVGGVRIKSKYTLEEVLRIVKDALGHPVGAFAASTTDMHHVLVHDRNIAEWERAQIAEDFKQIDSIMVGLRNFHPVGAAMNLVSVNAGALHTLEEKKPLTLDQADDLLFSINDLPSADSVAIPVKRLATEGGARRPRYKPPTRIKGGRVGYPASPTHPPKLPIDAKGKKETQGSGGAGASSSTGATSTGATRPVPGTSTTPPSKQKGGTAKLVSAIKAKFSSDAHRIRIGKIEALKNKGAIYVGEKSEIRTNFDFYRYDNDVKMSEPVKSSNAGIEKTREVLYTGNGKGITSLCQGGKMYYGGWGRGNRKLSAQTDVIELANGKEGVGAVRIAFADIPPKGSLLVTAGGLSGCTVMFAADNAHFYAYHVGTSTPTRNWKTAQDGVRLLRQAHEQLKPDATRKALTHPENNDLIDVAKQYPFASVIYYGKHGESRAQADTRITGAAGPAAQGTHIHDYFQPDVKGAPIGTAFALIRKDARGRISVSTLYERGELPIANYKSDAKGNVMYDFHENDAQIDRFTPQTG